MCDLHEQLVRLEQRKIPANDLVITAELKTLDQLSVVNLTYSALTRANLVGHEIIPGRKARFVVLDSTSNQPTDRVILLRRFQLELFRKLIINIIVIWLQSNMGYFSAI